MLRSIVDPQSEPVYSNYFTRRLESFSDVVFGFSLSFLATQLQVSKPGAPIEPVQFLGFFLTFAIIASLWYTHYRTFHYSFAAQTPDVIMNFVILAGVAFLPYALQLTYTAQGSSGFLVYVTDFAIIYALFAVLRLRGLRRFGSRLSAELALKIYHGVWASWLVAAVAVATGVLVYFFGPAWSYTFLVLFGRRLYLRGIREVPDGLINETGTSLPAVNEAEVADAHA